MKVIVICASSYSFTDSRTGSLIEGGNFFYVSPINSNSQVIGNEISKISLTFDEFQNLGLASMQLPAVCDVEIMTGTTIKGKSFSKLNNLKFVKTVANVS